jgi:hypothetical protein
LPEAAAEVETVAAILKAPNRVPEDRLLKAYTAYMPRSRCPWCEEREWLEQVLTALPSRNPALEARLTKLRDNTDHDRLLDFHGDDGRVDNSVLPNGADVAFAAMAAAIAELRVSARKYGTKEYYIDIAHLLRQWHGASLYAGIFRTVTQTEGSHGNQDYACEDAWRGRSGLLTRGELRELAWAGVRDSIPRRLGTLVRLEIRARFHDDALLMFLGDRIPAASGAA